MDDRQNANGRGPRFFFDLKRLYFRFFENNTNSPCYAQGSMPWEDPTYLTKKLLSAVSHALPL